MTSAMNAEPNFVSSLRASPRSGRPQGRLPRQTAPSLGQLWLCLGLLCLSLCAARPAQAAEPSSARLVFLGGFQPGRSGDVVQHEGLGRGVLRGLELLAEPHRVPRRPLTAELRGCRTLECLVQLAAEHDADRLLVADATLLTPALSLVRMVLFDARSQKTADTTIRCESCDDERLLQKVSSEVRSFIEQYPAAATLDNGVRPRSVELAGPDSPDSTACRSALSTCERQRSGAGSRATRRFLAGGFGALLLVGAVTTVAFASLAGSGTQLCTQSQDNAAGTCTTASRLAVTAGAVSLIPAIGLTITLALPLGQSRN